MSCRKDVRTPLVNSVYQGTESIEFLETKIRDTVADKIKDRTSINSFNNQLENGHQLITCWFY